ncbi:hypothetical protein AGMMS50212_12140 [Spirochaetia bacterium]|nr:hypothetical protein AGMMS50212_12140 [Spirochaetia bacterium]
MFNPMVSAVIAACVFAFSFTLGLVSRSGFFISFFRALFFGALFFGIIVGIYYVFNKFLNTSTEKEAEEGAFEDEDEDENAEPEMGGQIDVSIGDEDQEDGLEGDSKSGTENSFIPGKHIKPPILEELVPHPSPLDQNNGNVYTGVEKESDSGSEDMDMNVFLGGNDDGENEVKETPKSKRNESDGVVNMSVGHKPSKTVDLGPNVDGKKMAGAIQTMLRKDES